MYFAHCVHTACTLRARRQQMSKKYEPKVKAKSSLSKPKPTAKHKQAHEHTDALALAVEPTASTGSSSNANNSPPPPTSAANAFDSDTLSKIAATAAEASEPSHSSYNSEIEYPAYIPDGFDPYRKSPTDIKYDGGFDPSRKSPPGSSFDLGAQIVESGMIEPGAPTEITLNINLGEPCHAAGMGGKPSAPTEVWFDMDHLSEVARASAASVVAGAGVGGPASTPHAVIQYDDAFDDATSPTGNEPKFIDLDELASAATAGTKPGKTRSDRYCFCHPSTPSSFLVWHAAPDTHASCLTLARPIAVPRPGPRGA